MMKKLLSLILVFCSVAASAQTLDMVVKVKYYVKGTYADGTTVVLKPGEIVLPIDAFEYIDYKYKQLEGIQAVDLGLSVKWASKNYYQDPSKSELGELFPAPLDGDIVLNTWGNKYGHWRMPTKNEMFELICNCEWIWDTVDNVKGYWVCNIEDRYKSLSQKRKIFLPATGYDNELGHKTKHSDYWTITPNIRYADTYYYLIFDDEDIDISDRDETFLRAIRPVWSEDETVVYTVDIKDLSVSMTGATFTIEIAGGEIPVGAKCYYKWGDTNEMKYRSTPVSPESNTVAINMNAQLMAGKTYYFQAVLELESGEKIESEVESQNIPTTTLDITSNSIKEGDITENTATVSINFSGAYASISSYGILYTSNEGKKDALVKGTNDTDVHVVTQNGSPSSPVASITLTGLLPNTTYYFKSFACLYSDEDSIRYSNGVDSFKTQDGDYIEPNDSFPRSAQAVDLGLPSGIKWSPWNMGASEPTDTGGYYGWGDPTGRIKETRGVYYAGGKMIGDIAGTEYDIATYQWQGQWRLPQRKDFEELYKYCTFRLGKWENKGMDGWIVVNRSKTDSIFIPLAGYQNHVSESHEIYGAGETGYCYYWTSEADLDNSGNPYNIRLVSYQYYDIQSRRRWELYPIRPVYGPVNTSVDPDPDPVPSGDGLKIAGYDENYTTAIPADGVDLGLPSGTKWAAWNVGAMSYGDVGHYYAWGDMDLVERETYTSSNYNPSETINGFIVNTLSPSDDIASRLWKGDWRMPTTNDLDELLDSYNSGIYDQTINDYIYVQKYVNLQWTQDSLKDEKGNYLRDADGNVRTGQWGYKITSKVNGNSIFLPAGGMKLGNQVQGIDLEGRYWTSNGSYTSGKMRTHAEQMYFLEQFKPSTSSIERYIGCLVRPVKPKK